MKKKIILFYVDIKNRDLQSLSLISYFLKKKYSIFLLQFMSGGLLIMQIA